MGLMPRGGKAEGASRRRRAWHGVGGGGGGHGTLGAGVGRTCVFVFFQAEDGIRDVAVTGVQTCALPIYSTEGEFPREHCYHELFELKANCTPGLPALVCKGTTLSFRELNDWADDWAAELQDRKSVV